MSFKILIIMTFLLGAVNAWGNDAPHGSAVEAAQTMRVTDKYTQKWIPFPALSLKSLTSGEAESKSVTKGRVLIVVFVASWCVPCQQLMPDFKRIASVYEKAYTDVVYVFAHDTDPDAKAFASYHKISDSAYLGTAKVLEDFHQPELPSVYVADRFGWLVYRKLNVKKTDLGELETFLKGHTSF